MKSTLKIDFPRKKNLGENVKVDTRCKQNYIQQQAQLSKLHRQSRIVDRSISMKEGRRGKIGVGHMHFRVETRSGPSPPSPSGDGGGGGVLLS